MAFNATPNPPSTTPPISLTFSGLMLLKPGAADKTCEVGVHQDDRDHNFVLMLIINRPNRPPIAQPVFSGPLQAAFEIRHDVTPEAPPDFMVYEQTTFDRNVEVRPTDPPPFDHRWAINIGLKHADLDINDAARPVITLKTGVLYTPNLTERFHEPTLIRRSEKDELHQIAPNLAVSIQPLNGQKVILEGRDQGEPLRFRLPRDGDPPGTTYTLAFVNEPPSVNSPEHDEFALYYRIWQVGNAEIQETDRFTLSFTTDEFRLDEIPCMPTTRNP